MKLPSYSFSILLSKHSASPRYPLTHTKGIHQPDFSDIVTEGNLLPLYASFHANPSNREEQQTLYKFVSIPCWCQTSTYMSLNALPVLSTCCGSSLTDPAIYKESTCRKTYCLYKTSYHAHAFFQQTLQEQLTETLGGGSMDQKPNTTSYNIFRKAWHLHVSWGAHGSHWSVQPQSFLLPWDPRDFGCFSLAAAKTDSIPWHSSLPAACWWSKL